MHTNGIVKAYNEHVDEILTAKVLRKARQRTADISHSLTRKGAAQAKAELLNVAVEKAINLLYQLEPDGYPANVDEDGRILIPLPWGSAGRPMYGLRRGEGDTLRRYVQFLETQKRPAPRLFYFERRAWWLDGFTYPTAPDALAYWRLVSVNASIWRRFSVETSFK